MSERIYYDGKYTVKARTDGGLEFLRYGEAWPAADDLRFNNLVGVMFREQLDADAEIAALRAELERKDAALRDFAAAWREVAHRSGVKLEAWEDDEYILSAPERGPCGMTIHRRHATVLNAALRQRVAELERERDAARKEANVAAKKVVAALDKRWPNLNIEGWDNEEAAGIVAAALEKESNAKR